ncbi:MAG TPA: FAD:protein FMN transferase [Solirubrobacteraceae bacterium]|nr:FAD:protein FMN transferase [Solirubrobacteraceae bacterium]
MSASCTWRALGTTAVVMAESAAGMPAAHAAVQRELDAIDRSCSRFREDSELTMVNRAGGRRTAVGPLLIDALLAALRAARLTEGDVDPTIGQALVLAGYDRDFGSVQGSPLALKAIRAPGWRVVEVDAAAGTVRVPAGVLLDLGATAKALAADRAARAAAHAAGCGVLVNLGGDLATAGEPPAGGWRVRVTHDHAASADAPGETVLVTTGALATSSTAVRRWQRGAETVHHILDPATGGPAAGPWQTVSVAAATCVDANTAATAAIVRGEGAVAWLEHLGLPARLWRTNGSVERAAGWPEPAREAAAA